MNNLQSIIERNYKSIVERGLITDKTTFVDFTNKMIEELNELMEEGENGAGRNEELADYLLSGLCLAKHYGIDIEAEMNRKIDVNFERAKNGKNVF